MVSWQFSESREAKTIVDSHHAKLSHSFIRYTKLGNNVSGGENIVNANKDLVLVNYPVKKYQLALFQILPIIPHLCSQLVNKRK